MSSADHVHLEERIFIPESERGRTIDSYAVSVRLANVLAVQRTRLIGELHGLTYQQIGRLRNCGRSTLVELRDLVRRLQGGADPSTIATHTSPAPRSQLLSFPEEVHKVLLADLRLSVRLRNALHASGRRTLGDLQGFKPQDLLAVNNCGRKCVLELQSLTDRARTGEFSPGVEGPLESMAQQVAQQIEEGLAALSDRNRSILEARFAGKGGAPRTLEDIGSEFDLTRERVRQIVKVAVEQVRRGGGARLAKGLKALEIECLRLVSPLTPTLLALWLGDRLVEGQHRPHLYVRAIHSIKKSLPAWPDGPTRDTSSRVQSNLIGKDLQIWMRKTGVNPTTQEAFKYLKEQSRYRTLKVTAFLASVRTARGIAVDFPAADKPQLRLERLRIRDFARSVLAKNDSPLTPEEIVEIARTKYGHEAIVTSARGAANSLTPDHGFYLLGPRSFGLRKHFTSKESTWKLLRSQFEQLLARENRPLSTVEVGDRNLLPDFSSLNTYEMAQVIREDKRFIDLGRRLFGLATWGIQEREHIKDLLPKILADADRVLTVPQIADRLTRLRSASLFGLAAGLQRHPAIRPFGFGYYGLREWDDNRTITILKDRNAIEKAVSRSTPPVTFQALCESLGVGNRELWSQTLRKTCMTSPKLRRSSGEIGPDTLLVHRALSLESALVVVARALGRALPAYEMEWELNSRFGHLFSDVGLQAIEDRLAKSERFLRKNSGEFFLDEYLDHTEYDSEAIRAAAIQTLKESNDIAGCDQLMERLELLDLEIDDMSTDVLASILRNTDGLQEVAHQRFRAT